MKTLFTTLSLTFLFFNQSLFAQKVKIKKGTIIINNEKIASIKQENQAFDHYTINDINDNQLIFIKYMSPINESSSPYYIVRFLNYKKEAEIRSISIKGVIRTLYNSEVINGNNIDKKKMIDYVSKYGNDYSRLICP
jgi:hypothetical protein